MPKTLFTNNEQDESIIIPAIAESWRVPTQAILDAVEAAIEGTQVTASDKTITISNGEGVLGSFTLNQWSNKTIDLASIAANNYQITLTNGDHELGTFTLNQDYDSTIDFSSLVVTPSNKTITVKDSEGNTIGTFTLNQSADAALTIPKATTSKLGLVKVDYSLASDSSNPVENRAVKTALDLKADAANIGDGTLTIQKNGTNVTTFKANASSNATANITVPTAVTDLSDAQDYALAADVTSLESSLATVATSGSFTDLSNAPTIDATISGSSTNAVQNKAVSDALDLKADASSIGNGTLTIQKNGTNVQTFTANSSTNATANITVPTAVSDLSDASSYYTAAQVDSAIETALSSSLTYKGSCTYANLPSSGQHVGDVWNITNDFTMSGESYPAGTNVAWNGTAWDPLAPAIDLSPYALAANIGNSTITIATTTATVDTFTTNQSSNKTITIPAATNAAHGTVIVDSALSASSNNPVRNSTIYAAIGDIETILTTLNSGTGA